MVISFLLFAPRSALSRMREADVLSAAGEICMILRLSFSSDLDEEEEDDDEDEPPRKKGRRPLKSSSKEEKGRGRRRWVRYAEDSEDEESSLAVTPSGNSHDAATLTGDAKTPSASNSA